MTETQTEKLPKFQVESINGVEIPTDIPISLWKELQNSSLDLTEKLLKIHQFAKPESTLTIKDIEENFYIRLLIQTLATFSL